MKKDWEVKKLGEVCLIKPPKSEARTKLSMSDFVSFVPMESLGTNQKYFNAVQTRPLKEVEGSYTYFAEEDVLLAKITPCFENGKLGIAKNLENGIGFGSSEYIVFRTPESLYSEYLYYFLSRQQFREEGSKRMSGAVGHKRVAKEFIENILIPLPPLPTQQRIVAILDEAFDAIAQAKENTEKNLQNARELFDSYLQNIFSNPGKDWDVKKLGEVCKQITSSKRVMKSEYVDDGIPFYRSREIIMKTKNLPLEEVYYISEKRYSEFKEKYGSPNKNDILITAVGTVGIPYLVEEEEFYFKDGNLLWLRNINNSVFPKYLIYYFRSYAFNQYLQQLAKGSSQLALTIEKLYEIVIPFPSFVEQGTIVAKLDALSSETQKLEAIYQKKLTDLEELKKSILQRAFNGELTEA